jgi:hypothetical protein
MGRRIILGCTLGFVTAACSIVNAQSGQTISPPSEALGPRLILWSQAEKPQPIPLPLPKSATPKSKETKRPSSTAMRTFSGTIVKDGSRYVLRTPNSGVYQLDDQGKSSQYANHEVRLLGTLDEETRTVVMANIESLP